MAAVDTMAPAPTRTDFPDRDDVSGLVGADALMLTSSIVVVLITILSTFARRSGNHFLRIFLTVLSQLFIPLITYTISNTDLISEYPSPLLIVSAPLLKIIISRKTAPNKRIETDAKNNTIDVSNDSLIEQVTDLGWLGWLVFTSYGSGPNELIIPATFVILLSLVKVVQGHIASRLASQSFSVGRNARLVACYMEELMSEREPEQGSQSEFMLGYRYVVMGEEKQKRMLSATGYSITTKNTDDLITVDKIWACPGKLLHGDESNRNICLSFALCKLLKRRFEGLPMAESNSEKSLNLILQGPFSDPQKAFSIIETELAFLNDYLYSPQPYTYYGWFPILNIFLLLLFLGSNFYLAIRIHETLINHDSYLYRYYESIGNDLQLKHDYVIALLYFDAIVCLIIIFVTGLVEAWEVITYLLSDHARVALLCKYVRNYRKPWIRKTIERIYTHGKHWPNKLRQYSINKNKKEKRIKVPDEVKQAIIRSISANEGKPSEGSSSLERNNVRIPLAFDACILESHTERLLVWHIATSYCENHENARPSSSSSSSSQRKIASSLSKYCAYLVVSVPELIPDYTSWVKFMSAEVINTVHPNQKECRNCFRKRKWMRNVWCVRKLVDYEEPSDRPARVVEMGRELGGLLVTEIRDADRLWEILADLWAEMMIYVSMLSNDLDVHAENLGRGGEFITHVWALLSNIGINHYSVEVKVHS